MYILILQKGSTLQDNKDDIIIGSLQNTLFKFTLCLQTDITYRKCINYDLFFIDLWGVVHNGIELYDNSIYVLEELNRLKKELILLTNAPRLNDDVKSFLLKLGLSNDFSNKVFTSGQAALSYLLSNYKDKTFFHIGPPRDFNLFTQFKKNKLEKINDAEYLLCTGLFDHIDQDLLYYKKMLTLLTVAIYVNPIKIEYFYSIITTVPVRWYWIDSFAMFMNHKLI